MHDLTPPVIDDDVAGDWSEPHTPERWVHITAGGGNIGRFYWCNQACISLSYVATDGTPYDAEVNELAGDFSFIATRGDWHAYLLGEICSNPLQWLTSRFLDWQMRREYLRSHHGHS